MMAMSGTNVSSIPTPAMRPLTTNPSTRLPPRPTAANAAVVTEVTGPVKNASSAPWRGAATVVVRANTAHITARKMTGPRTGAVAQRSIRSDHVWRCPCARVVARAVVSVTQVKTASARARSSSGSRLAARSSMAVAAQDVQSTGQSARQPPTVVDVRAKRVGRRDGKGRSDRLGQGVDVPASWVEAHDLDAQPLGQDHFVDLDAAAGGDVGHRQRDDNGHGQLAHVRGEDQRAPQVRGVADDHDGVHLIAAVQEVRGQGLIRGHGVQRVGTREVGEGELAERWVGPAAGTDLDAGPRVVADRPPGAGEGVEQGGLAGVRAAHEGHSARARARRLAGGLVAVGDGVSHVRAPPCLPRCWPGSAGTRRSDRRRWPGSRPRRSSGTGFAAPHRDGSRARPAVDGQHPSGRWVRWAGVVPGPSATVRWEPRPVSWNVGYLMVRLALPGHWSRLRWAEVPANRPRRGSPRRPRPRSCPLPAAGRRRTAGSGPPSAR